MMKRVTKFRFNLIEIALSMAVIAIGLSSILVLFPIGINASKESIADNNLPDAAEYVLSLFRAGMMSDWYRDSNSFFNAIDTDKPSGNALEKDKNTWSVFLTGKTDDDELQKANFLASGNSGVYLYQQVSAVEQPDGSTEYVPDFSAMILVWKSPIENLYNYDWENDKMVEIKESVTDTDGNGLSTEKLMNTYHYACQLNVEFSWPADIPYKNRSKRMYVLDLCNMNHDFTKDDY